jgi:hypothetical protein
LGIGISLFGFYRGQTSGITNDSRESVPVDTTSILNINNNSQSMKFTVLGILFKIGLSFETGKWKFGLTLTTPSIGFYGDGSVKREESFYTSSPTGIDQAQPYIIFAESQSGKARYHHPFAIGAGIEYKSDKTRVAVAGEYFAEINPYYNMDPVTDPFVYPSTLANSSGMQEKMDQFLYVGNAARPVFNIGLGFSQALWKKLDLLAGAHTDFSSYQSTSDSKKSVHGTGVWDLYYLSTGFSYHQQRQSITLGFTYGFSPKMQIQPIAIVNPGTSPETMASMFSQSFSIVLGYTYYFPR